MSKNSSEKPKTPTSQGIIDSCDFPSNAASTQDCTGLIPSGPVNEDELESYEALYHYQPPHHPKSKILTQMINESQQLSPLIK